MIRINIENKKEEIKERHRTNFGRNMKRIRDAITNLQHLTNFYAWFQNQGNFANDKIERLICTDSKIGLIRLIRELEHLIHLDSIARNLEESEIKEEILHEFERLFNNFTQRDWAFDFLKLIDAKVCPYCNRCYTFSYRREYKPELDHYFPKSIYPYLTISIFNIVPCCSGCNKGKSNHYVDINNQRLCYPYEESFADNIIFETDLYDIDELYNNNIPLRIYLTANLDYTDTIDTYNEAFNIDKLYSQHDDYAREVIKKAISLNDSFFEDTYASLPNIFASPNDVKQAFYSNYLEPDDVGKRPLAKLTQDILHEYCDM